MRPEDRIDPSHQGKRSCLRALGVLLTVLGVVCLAAGVIDFATKFGSVEAPKLMFLWFVGIPLLAVGQFLARLGYMGAVARYEAGEIAPVATDTLNAVAEESSKGISTIARAIKEGLSDKPEGRNAETCPACGSALARICPACRAPNDADARFCDKCGVGLEPPADS